MYKNHKVTKTKKNKTAVITIRATEDEKRRLERDADASGLNLSKYLISSKLSNNVPRKKHTQADVCNTAIIQQVCNYIEETYGADKYLEEWSAKLWESLS